MIGERLQFHTISNNFIHQSQLGDLKQRSTTDAGVILTHTICLEWVKNLITSTLTFNIAQFFPSLNHQLLFLILDKAGLDHKVSNFFKNYLVGRKLSIVGMILFLLLLTLMLVLVKVLSYHLYFQLYISLLSFILLKNI